MELSTVRLVALIAGIAVAVVGVGLYEAWWTLAFAVGALAVVLAPRQVPPGRAIAFGAAITGAGILGGMSLFLLNGALSGATWWLAASILSLVAAVALALLASRLRRPRLA